MHNMREVVVALGAGTARYLGFKLRVLDREYKFVLNDQDQNISLF